MNYLYTLLKKIILSFFFLSLPLLAFSQPLRVGVIDYPPFNIIKGDVYSGISIDIWRAIAVINNWDCEYIPLTGTIDEGLQKVRNGQLDVLVGPMNVTHARLQSVDFARSFFIEETSITMPLIHNYSLVFKEFLSKAVLYLLSVTLLCLLIHINLIWFFERGKNEKIPPRYMPAMRYLFWAHILVHGIGLPKTRSARITSLIWILLTISIFSSYNASLTSSLTLALSADKKAVGFDELKDMRLVGISGTMSTDLAQSQGFSIQTVPNVFSAFDLLEKHQVDGFISSDIIAKYYLQKHPVKQKYIVASLERLHNESAFAVPLNSPLAYPINLALTKLQDNKETVSICLKYLKTLDAQRCDL